jgi:hypothetical protein
MSIVQLDQASEMKHISHHEKQTMIFECVSTGLNQFVVPANTLGMQTFPLGLGYSNLQSLDFCFTPVTDNTGKSWDHSRNDTRSQFIRNFLERYDFIVDGQSIEATRGVKIDKDSAEAVAMSLISSSKLTDFDSDLFFLSKKFQSIDEIIHDYQSARVTDASFVASLDLCVMKNGKQDLICSGRSVLEASTQLQCTFGANATGLRGVSNLFVFPHFRQHIILDMSPSGDGLFHVIQ